MLLELFWSFLKVGLFSFGGGLVSITLISQEIVTQKGWLTASVFADLIAIAESTPGPIAVNAATFVGMQLGGFIGALVATTAAILPGVLFSLGVGLLYQRYRRLTLVQGMMDGLRPVIVASIFVGGVTIMRNALLIGGMLNLSAVDWLSVVIFIIAFILAQKTKLSAVMLIVGGGVVGGAMRLLLGM